MIDIFNNYDSDDFLFDDNAKDFTNSSIDTAFNGLNFEDEYSLTFARDFLLSISSKLISKALLPSDVSQTKFMQDLFKIISAFNILIDYNKNGHDYKAVIKDCTKKLFNGEVNFDTGLLEEIYSIMLLLTWKSWVEKGYIYD